MQGDWTPKDREVGFQHVHFEVSAEHSGGNLTIRRMEQVTGEVWAGIRFPQDIISCFSKKEAV